MQRQFTAVVMVLGSSGEKGQQWVCAQHPCPPPPHRAQPISQCSPRHLEAPKPGKKFNNVLAWLASLHTSPFPFPVNITFFGNRAIADVTSYGEVTLKQGQPLIQYDWCPTGIEETQRQTYREKTM